MLKWLRNWFKRRSYKRLSPEVQHACEVIASFYLDKFQGSINCAIDHIYLLRIEKIEVKNRVITITTRRPGMLIGLGGNDYEGLSKALGHKFKIIESMGHDYTDLIICACVREESKRNGSDLVNDW